MNLTTAELRVLAKIWNAYPIVHDPEDQTVIAIGERPVLTAEDITSQIGSFEHHNVADVLRNLECFQCVSKVYLHHPDEFAEQTGTSGEVLRMVVLGPPRGKHAFQATELGKQRLDARVIARIRAAASSVLTRVVHDYVRMLIAFLLGALITSYFGRTLSGLPTLNNSGEPMDAQGAAAENEKEIEAKLPPCADP